MNSFQDSAVTAFDLITTFDPVLAGIVATIDWITKHWKP